MASSTLTPAQQQALDNTFKRMLRNGGLNEDLPISLSSALTESPTEARDFYVDGTEGNDTVEGTSTRPFKTIGRAVKEVLNANNYDIRIFVRPGTYAEVIKVQTLTSYTANVQIIGTDYTLATAATGSATGTATSFNTTTRKLLVTGAGWTPSNFKGCMLRFTSGSLSAATQLPFPIYDNDEDELEIPFLDSSIATGAAGATFEIFKPAATIKFPASPTTGSRYSIESAVHGNLGRSGLIIQNIVLDGTNASACAAVSGGINFQACLFENVAGTLGVANSFSPGSILAMRNCYVQAPRITSNWYWAAIFLRNNVFVTNTGHQFQLDYPGMFVGLQKLNYFETTNPNSGPAIFAIKNGHATIYATEEQTVKNCGHFIKAEGANNNFTFTQRVNIVSAGSPSFTQGAIWFTEGAAYAGGGNRLFMNNVNVTACTGSFLGMETFQNSVWIANGTINNCTGTAIRMSNSIGTGTGGCYNFVSAYNTSMSGNGADFSIDGTATLTKAAALSAGTTTDATLFNRLVVT